MSLYESSTLSLSADGSGSALLQIDVPDRSVNVITTAFLKELDAALDVIARESSLRVLVIRGKKKTGFLAGGDLAQFSQIATSEQGAALAQLGQQVFNKLELLPIPTVAVIHGPCLGGGVELALACDYRLVVDNPTTQLGMPEVELGLLPGWGGTQRLPRVVGLEPALRLILTARRLRAREALQLGLADQLARTEAELRAKLDSLLTLARVQGKRRKTGLPLRTWRQKMVESSGITRRLILRSARRQLERRVPDDMPAPREALEAVRRGMQEGMAAGLAYEREAAGRLCVSPACRNLIRLFLQREHARKASAGDPPHKIQRVGVIGAGVMGAGIAQLAALRGCEVVVQEVNAETLGKGILRVEELFRKGVERGAIPAEEAARKINAIRGTTAWEGFADLDLILEAAVEDLEVKRAIFVELEQRASPSAVLATNTSSLPIATIVAGLKQPQRIGGLHFFNPVHKMELVEVIGAATTDASTRALLVHWARSLGKTPVEVGDGPGFVVNRVLMPYLNEAVQLVAEGLTIEQVDRVMKQFGMPVGPLELLDQIGLDVAAHVARHVEPHLGQRLRLSPAFLRLSESGWLGQKSGAGFYKHRTSRSRVNRDVLPLLRSEAAPLPTAIRALPMAARLQQARERMVLLMVNEAAHCLQAGLATDPQTIDLALVLGAGWAPHRGGPLSHADATGIARIVETLRGLVKLFGTPYEPSESLQRLSETNRRFYGA